MVDTIAEPSTTFVDIFFDADERIRDGREFGDFVVTEEIKEGDITIAVEAEFGVYEEPLVYLAFHGLTSRSRGVTISVPDRAIGSLSSMTFRDDEKGFEEPLPTLSGLVAKVQDEWGNRRYFVPDDSEEQVTVALLDPAPNDEGFHLYLEPTPVDSAEDVTMMRALVNGALSALVAKN